MKNKKLIIGLVGVFLLVFFSNMISPSISVQDNPPELSQGEVNPDELIKVDLSIYIDGNWSEYVEKYDWCSGKGTEEDPYIIEGIHVTNENMTAHISIETAEYFIIRNVTVSNYAAPYGHHVYAGIYIEKGEYGLIENCTIINCTRGISLYEAKDVFKITNCKFIGSHNDSITGMGPAIVIQEAKGVNISFNDIYNYYTGIVVKDAEEIYIENNRIEASFENITDTGVYPIDSDTGVYFINVNDSTIIDNDFYGCKPTTQNSVGISMSSWDNPIVLDNCYDITVSGNEFYDSNGNLITDESESSSMPDYWIFIISGIAIVAVVVVVVVLIKKKSK